AVAVLGKDRLPADRTVAERHHRVAALWLHGTLLLYDTLLIDWQISFFSTERRKSTEKITDLPLCALCGLCG
ncbi:MAG: hypothetical protein KDE58_20170, partial [Caldilineaceae bacterium]|nr:hypothetical protein [Caldilineaceae bacterium]